MHLNLCAVANILYTTTYTAMRDTPAAHKQRGASSNKQRPTWRVRSGATRLQSTVASTPTQMEAKPIATTKHHGIIIKSIRAHSCMPMRLSPMATSLTPIHVHFVRLVTALMSSLHVFHAFECNALLAYLLII